VGELRPSLEECLSWVADADLEELRLLLQSELERRAALVAERESGQAAPSDTGAEAA
jgi:hypothetical protein